MNTPKCPKGCYDRDLYVNRIPTRDTAKSHAYLCCACGTIFYLFINQPVEVINNGQTESK